MKILFFATTTVSAAWLSNSSVAAFTPHHPPIRSQTVTELELVSEAGEKQSSANDYKKYTMAKRKDQTHMGVLPRTNALRGAMLRPIGFLTWPLLMVWIMIFDSASLFWDHCSSTANAKSGVQQSSPISTSFFATATSSCTAALQGFEVVTVSILQGASNTFAAALLLSNNAKGVAKYCFFIAPWWVRNRLRPQNGMDSNLEFFPLITADRTLLDFIESHTYVRYEARDFLEAERTMNLPETAQMSRMTTNAEMSIAGGSIITQYILFGDDIFEYSKDHELVSAAAHILDDFNDEIEDKELGNLNHFVHHFGPNATEEEKRKHAEQWVRTLYDVHSRHAMTPFGRFIRGTMFFLCNAEDRVRLLIENTNDKESGGDSIPLPRLTWNNIEW